MYDEKMIEKILDDLLDRLKWNETTIVYTESKEIPRIRGANGYVATNLGDTNVVVNGKMLFPSATPLTVVGDSISMMGNTGEVFQGRITVQFQLPLGVLPRVEIVQKFYTSYQ